MKLGLLALAAAAAADDNLPQVPYHARGGRTGFSMAPRSSYASQTMDVFLDMFCEDSKATWPTLKALAAKRPDVDIRIQLFPLPYNFGTWMPAQACTAAAMLTNSSATFVKCVDVMSTAPFAAARPRASPNCHSTMGSVVRPSWGGRRMAKSAGFGKTSWKRAALSSWGSRAT